MKHSINSYVVSAAFLLLCGFLARAQEAPEGGQSALKLHD